MSHIDGIICGEINVERVSQILVTLQMAKQAGIRARIWICSHGGDLLAALAIYDALRRSPDAEVIATGTCQSAALMCLLGAHWRQATPNTIFLGHDIFDGKTGETVRIEPQLYIESPALGLLRQCPTGLFGAKTAVEKGLIQGVFEEEIAETATP